MTGVRVVVGVGNLSRTTEKISELPFKSPGVRKTPLEIVTEGLLTGRFGSGVEITINRNRNLDYKTDIGFREFTLTTPGMYDIEFSLSGYLTPRDLDVWGETLFINDRIELSKTTLIYTTKTGGTGTALSTYTPTTEKYCYVAGTSGSRLEIPIQLMAKYKEDVNRATSPLAIRILYPKIFSNPNTYALDIASVEYNRHTPKGGADKVSVLCGCIFDTGSISYESGGDAGVKFTIDGFALRDYISLVDGSTVTPIYVDSVDEVDNNIFATGCFSILKTNTDTAFEPIAYTDSVKFTISNKVEKLAECGELVYSGGILGSLEIGLEVQTYSNEPDRYLPAMYGVTFEKTGIPLEYTDKVYSVAKLPKPINAMLVRSTDSYYVGTDADVATTHTKFIDVVLRDVFVGGLNHTYSVDSKIMDEPTLRPRTAWIAYGYVLPTP